MSAGGFIYFIQVGHEGPVKIGWSANPTKRLASLQTAHHEKLYLRGCKQGSSQDEASLHAELRQYRINGEWFDPHDDVFAQIETDHAIVGLKDATRLLAIAVHRLEVSDVEECVRMLSLIAEDISTALEILSPAKAAA